MATTRLKQERPSTALDRMEPLLTPKEAQTLLALQTNYKKFKQMPCDSPVRKGDILRATAKAQGDPVFRDSEIIFLGYNNGMIIGTSLQRLHSAYFFNGTWDVRGLRYEMTEKCWERAGSLGNRNLVEYFVDVNKGRNCLEKLSPLSLDRI